jgi:dTDP-L-rhamnose 4-epimerase
MKILITGGAGFIGSNLSLQLNTLGHEVTVLDSLSPQIHGADPKNTSPLFRSIAGKVKFIEGSVCDVNAWREALQGQEAIVHLAAETGTGQSMYEVSRYVDVNIGGTGIFLNFLANETHTVRKVVIASSRAIYGEGKYHSKALGVFYPTVRNDTDMRAGKFDPLCPSTGEPLELLPTDEDSVIHPTSVYGITKQTQEQLVMSVCGSLGIGATALRYQNVYGPGQSLSNPYTGILSIFSTRILNRNPINIFEDGKESRDFIFISDVVEATCLALLKDEANGQVFGIGSGVPTTVLDVAHELVKQYEIEVPIAVTGAYRLGDIRHNYADLTKAKQLLEFSPQVTFREGVRQFADWVKQQEVHVDAYEKSIEEMKSRGLMK